MNKLLRQWLHSVLRGYIARTADSMNPRILPGFRGIASRLCWLGMLVLMVGVPIAFADALYLELSEFKLFFHWTVIAALGNGRH